MSLSAVSDAAASCQPLQVIRDRCRTQQQEIACTRLERAVARATGYRGGAADFTWKQLAAACGLDVTGMTQQQARHRYRAALRNQIDYLISWGLLSGFQTLYEPNGEGRCIVVHIPAGVAQSVRASRYRRTYVRSEPPRRRSSISPKVGTPPRGDIGGPGDFCRLGEKEREDAAARARELGTRDLALLSAPVRAALGAAAEELRCEWGGGAAELLRTRPELAAAPASVLAREAWRVAGHRDCRLSLAQFEALRRASSQLERTGYGTVPPGPAAPAAAIIDLAFGGWAEHWRPRRDGGAAEPGTLGGLVVCLRKEAHRHLRGWRGRRAVRRQHD